MTLRVKTLLIVGLTLMGLGIIVYATSRVVLLGGFLRLEEQQVLRNLQRAQGALADDVAQLSLVAQDWATWDDTYQFVRDLNSHYQHSNVVRDTFVTLKLDALLYVDPSGRVVFGRGFDRKAMAWRPYPPAIDEHLARPREAGAQPHILSLPGPMSTTAGILSLPEGPMLIASRPILTSTRGGPSRGALLMGRYLTEEGLHRIAQVTHLSLSLRRLDEPGLRPPSPPNVGGAGGAETGTPDEDQAAARACLAAGDAVARPLDADRTSGYTLLRDIYGEPALLLRLDAPRPIYWEGRAAMAYFLICLIAAGLVFGIVSVALLERVVLSRLARLHESMTSVVARGDLSVRVPEAGKDEIASVASAANRMLEAMDRRDAVLGAVSFAAERFLRASTWEESIGPVLEHLGQAAAVSRVYVFESHPDDDGPPLTSEHHVWRAPGIHPPKDARRFQRFSPVAEGLGRWLEILSQGQPVYGRFGDFPEAERSILEEQGIRSIVLMPIFVGDRRWGSIVLEDCANEREWSQFEIDALRAAADTLGAAIQRRREEDERKRLETQVQHTQRLESLGVLAGGIAHDFNNLLMAVLANAELAAMRLPQDSEVRPLLERVQVAALRAAELTNQMLAYAGKASVSRQPLDLADLVREMTGLLDAAVSKKAALRLDFAPDIPAIQGDASQIRQVVMNLITNASEAIGDSAGVITVSGNVGDLTRSDLHSVYGGDSLPEGRYVILTVSDTGCGMSPTTRARIFDPFFTTKFLGRGLGLAAVLGIVRGHGGAIRVESEPGRGSMFQIILPCATAEEPAVPCQAPQPSTTPIHGTILVVDDEEGVRDAARATLEQFGFTALTAEDGREGVEVFREHASEISAVLLDLNMPLMDGEEAFREIQQIRPGTRVILSSGYTEEDAGSRLGGSGVAGFIQKPYRPTALVEKIRQVID